MRFLSSPFSPSIKRYWKKEGVRPYRKASRDGRREEGRSVMVKKETVSLAPSSLVMVLTTISAVMSGRLSRSAR